MSDLIHQFGADLQRLRSDGGVTPTEVEALKDGLTALGNPPYEAVWSYEYVRCRPGYVGKLQDESRCPTCGHRTWSHQSGLCGSCPDAKCQPQP